ncbi:MAG TPA: tripartite tricarboxylate transporter substrate binding protein, partial [Ramlibacter sp.]|nr:tripartite tricarboxylate transporter substrate binding protein [Ramlibacter sp.]
QRTLKRPVVVENKPGTAGTLAAQEVARALPDGQTFLVSSTGPLAISPHVYETELRFQPLADFVPVAQLASLPLFVAVSAASPYRSLKDFVQQGKARPGSLNYASSGTGTTGHVITELLKKSTGMVLNHVAYKGSALAIADLIEGQIDLMIDTGPALLPHIKAGKLRLLAVTQGKRSPLAPDVPTLAEAGIPGIDAAAWVGLLAPKGTPADVVRTLHRALTQAWLAADVKNALAPVAADAVLTSPEDFQRLLAAEIKRWAPTVKAAGVQVE